MFFVGGLALRIGHKKKSSPTPFHLRENKEKRLVTCKTRAESNGSRRAGKRQGQRVDETSGNEDDWIDHDGTASKSKVSKNRRLSADYRELRGIS